MLGRTANGATINLKCTETALPEFPTLLFGTQIESGKQFFDATSHLSKQERPINVRDFLTYYNKPIESLCEAYDIRVDDVYKINEQGHYLINSNFVYLYIAFVEPNFLGYICDRIHELFTYGVSVSDTYLLKSAKSRLSAEVLRAITPNNENDQ